MRRCSGESAAQVRKALRSIQRRIHEHLDKIAHPDDHLRHRVSDEDVKRLVTVYWPKEVETFRQQAEILRALLKERGDGD